MDMATFAFSLALCTTIYSVLVIPVCLGDLLPRLKMVRLSIYGMFFCFISQLAIIGALIDGNSEYSLVAVFTILMAFLTASHLLSYLTHRPLTKEEGLRLAGR